jgi:hypothetical protein
MTKTLVEELRANASETAQGWSDNLMLSAASRIEELERALIPFALAGASLSSRWQGHETHWQDALPCGISAGQLRAARQALLSAFTVEG